MNNYNINRRDLIKTGVGGALLSGSVTQKVSAGGPAEEPTVYVGSNENTLYAVSAITGEVLWIFDDLEAPVQSSPTVVNGVVYFVSYYTLYAVDAVTGEKIWSLQELPYYTFDSSPTIVDGTIYLGNDESTNGGKLTAIDVEKQEIKWTYSQFPHPGPYTLTPAVRSNRVFIPENQATFQRNPDIALQNARLHTVDATTGKKKWDYYYPNSLDYSVQYWTSPTVSDGCVYIGSNMGVHAIDVSSGNEQWVNTQITATDSSSPTVYDGNLYIGDQNNSLYALDTQSGEKEWEFTGQITPHDVPTSPTVAHGLVYVGLYSGMLCAINTENGNLEWKYTDPSAEINSSPTVYNGRVYFGSNEEKIYSLDRTTGEVEWIIDSIEGQVHSSPTVVGNPDSGYSVDSRVNLGTLGHHHVFAEEGPTGPGIPDDRDLVASFTFDDESPNIGDTVTFDASGSSPTEDIQEYRWNFTSDEEIDDTGVTVERIFEDPEEQTVKLTVVDGDGNDASTEKSLTVDPLPQIPIKRDRIEEIRQRTTTYLSDQRAENEIEQEAEQFVDKTADEYPTATSDEKEQFEQALDRMIRAEESMNEAVEAPKGALKNLSPLIIGLSTTLTTKKLTEKIGNSSTFEKLQGWITKRGGTISEDAFDGLVGAGTTPDETISGFETVSEDYQKELIDSLGEVGTDILGEAVKKGANEEFAESRDLLPDEVTDVMDNARMEISDAFENTIYTAYLQGPEGIADIVIPEPGDVVIPEDDAFVLDVPDEFTGQFGVVPDEIEVPVSPDDVDIPEVPDLSEISEIFENASGVGFAKGVNTAMEQEVNKLTTKIEDGEIQQVNEESLISVENKLTSAIRLVGDFAEKLTSIMKTASTLVGDFQSQMESYTAMVAGLSKATGLGSTTRIKTTLVIGKISAAIGVILLQATAAISLITVASFWLIDIIHEAGAKAMLNTDLNWVEEA